MITDILLFKHFAKTKKINEYDTNYNNVMTFYSKVIDALQEFLTENQVKKIRKKLSETVITTKYYLRQWFMIVSINYMRMTKKKRQKEMMHTIESICDSYLYDKYYEVKKEVEQFAKENDIPLTEIEYGEYPEKVEW